jgi:hypothetical protein
MSSAASADVLVNFASQASAVAYGGASAYSQFIGGTSNTYTVTFSTPGGVTVLASLSGVTFDAGAIYTAYLLGPPASPQVKLVRDR